MPTVRSYSWLAALVLLAISPEQTQSADVPPAPKVGKPYPHKSVRRTEIGTGVRSYTLFEPAGPTPEVAPVVVFCHGWLSMSPGIYGSWIEHLARRGHVVIFPRYQDDWTTPAADFLANAQAAVVDAMDVLATSGHHIRPDRNRFALVGHSAGGNLAAQLAATAKDLGLPEPKALVAIMPGEVLPIAGPDLSRIPAKTNLAVVAASQDIVVGDGRARAIFAGASSIPRDRKKYILIRTDLRGTPRLWADHLAPTAAQPRFDNGDGPLPGTQIGLAEINALDRAGFWRIGDITIDAGFSGQTLDDATGRGDAFRHLGFWSDGRLVAPPIVGDDLSTIPRVFPAHGLRLFPWPTIPAPRS